MAEDIDVSDVSLNTNCPGTVPFPADREVSFSVPATSFVPIRGPSGCWPNREDNLWDGARVYGLAPDGGMSCAGQLGIPKRAGAVDGRAHAVRREHAFLAIHRRDPA